MLVGNSSTRASARVSGASRVCAYSAATGSYLSETLIGIGRGAWACNDTPDSRIVSIADEGNVVGADWPGCCSPTAYAGSGKALLVFKNDSSYPLISAARATAASGELLSGDDRIAEAVDACANCPEYANHASCNAAAVTWSVVVTPGDYVLHLQADGPNVPDLLTSIQVQADTSYVLCYFVTSGRH